MAVAARRKHGADFCCHLLLFTSFCRRSELHGRLGDRGMPFLDRIGKVERRNKRFPFRQAIGNRRGALHVEHGERGGDRLDVA